VKLIFPFGVRSMAFPYIWGASLSLLLIETRCPFVRFHEELTPWLLKSFLSGGETDRWHLRFILE